MTGPLSAADVKATACLDLVRRLAADQRRSPQSVWPRVAALGRLDLEQAFCVALALVPAGPVDAWWDRGDLTVEQLHRRDVLLGKAS